MNRENILLELSRMTARVAALEGQPVPQITAAIRREAEAIRLGLPGLTIQVWAEAVHRGDEFQLTMR